VPDIAARARGWAFIDLAELGRNSWRSYVVTLLRVILLPAAFLGLAFAAIFAAVARHLLAPSGEPIAAILVAFAVVIVAGIALAWGIARTHRRPWLSLISTDLQLDWRRLAIGAGVEGALLATAVCLAHLFADQPWGFVSTLPLPALAAVILLVPFQAASEEMLFRGYLTQAFGRLVRNRGVIAACVGVLFGALHFNAYGALTLPYLGMLSLIYSLVSLRDERLELTIGAHAATNWFAIAAAGALDNLGRGEVQLDWGAIAALLANGALFYAITRLLVRLFCDRRGAA
jgi:uncharacterized protein